MKTQTTPENTHPVQTDHKAYAPPEVVYEAQLEVRAGSPLGLPDPFAVE